MSRRKSEARFPDDAACARYLVARRWPDGIVCPACGGRKAWELGWVRPGWECARCRRQTSATTGTILHASYLSLKTWFLAAHICASHSKGMSALQLHAQLGIGRFKTAWLLLHQLRLAMVDPDRNPLETSVEIDETEMPFRSRQDMAVGRKGARSPVGKIFVLGAVELSAEGAPRRLCLAQIPDGCSSTLRDFIARSVAPGAHGVTDGWLGYQNLPANCHEAHVVTGRKAHEVLVRPTGSFRTLSVGPWGCFTAFARLISCAIATNSCSAGTEDALKATRATASRG